MIEPESSLPVASLRRLESLCTRFEEGQSPDDRDIGRLMREVEHQERPWLLQELIALDIELRLADGQLPQPDEYEQHYAIIGEAFQPGLIQEMIVTSEPTREAAPRSSRYLFLERIGRGGNGDVWRVQDHVAQRTLAIKVLRAELGQRAKDNNRLPREALLTGALQHPGIPPIYEHGQLDDGTFYFSMRLVGGTTFEDILKLRPPTDRQADDDLARCLAIFEQVAQTVAYAHAEGVIHRDLKPSNIMVGEFGEVQVMDWGVAKRLRDKERSDGDHAAVRELTIETTSTAGDTMSVSDASRHVLSHSLTATGEILGTPAYMPPEQARGDVSSLDKRSDVFALGAVLYELLTRRRLHEGCSLTESLRRSARGDFAASLEYLHDETIPGDLRSLCLRCLSPSPDGRPDNASEVAETIAHHLASVERRARQAELHEQEAKVRAAEEVKRRRIQTFTAFAIAAVSIVGVVAVMWQWNNAVEANVRKGEALELADERLVLANERLLQTQAVVDDYLTEIAKDDGVLTRTPGAQELRRSLLEKARDYYFAFVEQASHDAAVLEGAARASSRLGEVYFLLDPAGEEFHECYDKAIELYEKLRADEPTNPDYLAGIAGALGEKGRSYALAGDSARALEHFEEARATWQEVVSLRGEAADQFGLAMMTHNIGNTLSNMGKLDQAEPLLLEALDLATPILESTPDDPERLMQTCRMHNNAGTHFGFRRGKWQRCYELYQTSFDLAERLVQAQPQRHRSHQQQARQSMNLGLALYQLKRFDESEQAFLSALRTKEMLLRDNPTVIEYRQAVARNCVNLTTFLFKRQRFQESQEYAARAAEMYLQLARDNPDIVPYQDEAGSALYSLASIIPDSPRAVEAIRQLAALWGEMAEKGLDPAKSRASQAYWLGLLREATADELLSLTETFAADAAQHKKTRSQAFGGCVLALIRSSRHREALELLKSVPWKDEVATCLLLECMARFPTDPQAAAGIYKRAEKKIGPANSRDYDVAVLRREAQELLDE